MPREKITPADCRKCGVCCLPFHEQDAFCDIDDKDAERMGKKLVRKLVLFPSIFDSLVSAIDHNGLPWGAIKTKKVEQTAGPFKGCEVCMCAALTGNILHRVRCTIYAVRPRTCHRAVKPGDKACRQARIEYRRMAEEEA
jgi:Fe-S-cluster containining protein